MLLDSSGSLFQNGTYCRKFVIRFAYTIDITF